MDDTCHIDTESISFVCSVIARSRITNRHHEWAPCDNSEECGIAVACHCPSHYQLTKGMISEKGANSKLVNPASIRTDTWVVILLLVAVPQQGETHASNDDDPIVMFPVPSPPVESMHGVYRQEY